MKRTDYLALREKFEREYRQNIEALERIWRASQEDIHSSVNPPTENRVTAAILPAPQINNDVKGVTSLATEFIRNHQGTFSTRDILAYIKEKDPVYAKGLDIASISNTMWRLKRNDFVDLIEKGKGRRPSLYKRKP